MHQAVRVLDFGHVVIRQNEERLLGHVPQVLQADDKSIQCALVIPLVLLCQLR